MLLPLECEGWAWPGPREEDGSKRSAVSSLPPPTSGVYTGNVSEADGVLIPAEPVLVTGWEISYFIHGATGDRALDKRKSVSWGWGIPLQLLLVPPHSAPVSDAPGAEHTSLSQGRSGGPISSTMEGTLAWVA